MTDAHNKRILNEREREREREGEKKILTYSLGITRKKSRGRIIYVLRLSIGIDIV